MAKLMVHRDLLKSFGRLPSKVQKRGAEFVETFQKDPADPSLHVHPLKESMLDPKVRGGNLPESTPAPTVQHPTALCVSCSKRAFYTPYKHGT